MLQTLLMTFALRLVPYAAFGIGHLRQLLLSNFFQLMTFDTLGLRAELLRAVDEQGYTDPTPIQRQSIPVIVQGRDVMASAQTGTGKTAGFTLPLLQRLCENLPAQSAQEMAAATAQPVGKRAAKSSGPILKARTSGAQTGQRSIRALIVTPTRELAAQVGESVATYGKYLPLRSTVIFGGVKINPQISKLRQGIDILVATPGRLLDHVNQQTVDLSQVEILSA